MPISRYSPVTTPRLRITMHKAISSCRICGSSDLAPILDLGEQALTGVFPKDVEEDVEKGPLRLVKCQGADACGLVQLEHTFSLEAMYGQNYGYRSGLNATMVKHLESKVTALMARFEVPAGSLVLDIGSNDGTTLASFPARYERVGIDPAAAKFLDFYQPGILAIPDLFSAEVFRAHFGSRQAAIVTSFAMFYDLEDPMTFMSDIKSVLAPDGLWVFEQSYLPLMIERNAYDTVCHEHIEYYSLSQVKWMADRVGFKIIDIEFNDINGGSFSVIAAHAASGYDETPALKKAIAREDEAGYERLGVYAAFAERVEESRSDLLMLIDEAHRLRQTVAALGASTKGNVLLQYCGLTSRDILGIGEINEDKYGAFTPGSHIPIMPEEEILDLEPDYLLVLPWHFRATFRAKQIKGHSKLVFPLPELEVVTDSLR